MKISKKWLKMSEIYKRFAKDYEWDFSDKAKKEMYLFESRGIEIKSENNGYAIGKKWMDVTIAMWKEDLANELLFREELENDYPEWFLTKINI